MRQRLRAGPHGALGHVVDRLRRGLARGGRAGDEVLVGVVDVGLHHRQLPRVGRAPRVAGALQPVGAVAAGAHAQLVQRALGTGQQGQHADRPGDGGFVSQHLVGGQGDPIAARRSDVAHRHHHRLACGARDFQFAPDQLAAVGAAAGRVDANHQRLDTRVLARLPHQFDGGLAVGDQALDHHHADCIAAPARIDSGQVGIERDLLVALAVGAGAAALDEGLAQLLAGLDCVDPARRLGQLRPVTAGGQQAAGQGVQPALHAAGRQLARALDAVGPGAPQRVVQASVGAQGFGRRRVGAEDLAGVLVLAGPHHVGADADPVQQVAVVVAPAAQAADLHAAHRVQPDLAGVGCHEVLALAVARRPGDYRLAGGLEAFQRCDKFAQAGQARASEVFQHEYRVGDLRVGRGSVQHSQQVAQLQPAVALAAHLPQQPAPRAVAVLFDQRARQCQHQRGLVLQRRRARPQRQRQQAHQQRQQQQVQQRTAGGVEQAPEADDGTLQGKQEGHDGDLGHGGQQIAKA